ncbi:MAG TPA: hypothetical protein VLA74_11175 [Nitrososphaeraceae archaeon]|nr:hypothetical protein [Nitrososphaeraceae archaeon]
MIKNKIGILLIGLFFLVGLFTITTIPTSLPDNTSKVRDSNIAYFYILNPPFGPCTALPEERSSGH